MESETPKVAEGPKDADNSKFSRTVMIALDSSADSEHAFQWALKNFIRADGNDLVILATVREPVLIPGAYGMYMGISPKLIIGYMDFGDYIAEAEEQSRLRAHVLVKKYGQDLLKHFNLPAAVVEGKISVKGIVMRGDPRDELIRKSQESGACALVLGSRGLGTFKRAFLGSVSDYIVHHSEIPVIIVKKPKH
jgi:nucleotide-binding universal stress UspA family protein